ncbi:MAG: IcmT/TraK family protein [Rhodobacteraceae bacterium]|nr:IcmT/TraK family protein [Paracoccaceae bacterium]
MTQDGNIYGRRLYWRATMQPAKLFLWDARIAPALGLFIVHARLTTFVILVLALILASWCEYRGISIPAALRGVRAALAGDRRRATSRLPCRPASYMCAADHGVWDPALMRIVPPPRWQRRADRFWTCRAEQNDSRD